MHIFSFYNEFQAAAPLLFAVCAVAASAGAAPGGKIQRAMSLLAGSTPESRNTVRILFYGQSIVRQGFAARAIEADLRECFPHAEIICENRAIGGYNATKLIRTAEHDLYPFYPDLLVFHVYGGEEDGTFEGILRNVRLRTTAEILTWTHHPDAAGAARDPGAEHRRIMAEKYGCELADLRKIWQQHLLDENMEASEFLSDSVHLNEKGGQLMAEILLPFFRHHPDTRPDLEDNVVTLMAADAFRAGGGALSFEGGWKESGEGVAGSSGAARLVFTGNRVDITAFEAEPGSAAGSAGVFIDGKPVSSHPGAYAATLPGPTPIDYRPALKRVTLGESPAAEDWTLTVREVSADGKEFSYDVAGSVTGPDGSGTHEGVFVSDSGRIILDPEDFSFAEAVSIRERPLPDTFEIGWSVYLAGADAWRPGQAETATLVQGIPNSGHILEIRANGDGVLPVKSFTVYRPPRDTV